MFVDDFTHLLKNDVVDLLATPDMSDCFEELALIIDCIVEFIPLVEVFLITFLASG